MHDDAKKSMVAEARDFQSRNCRQKNHTAMQLPPGQTDERTGVRQDSFSRAHKMLASSPENNAKSLCSRNVEES